MKQSWTSAGLALIIADLMLQACKGTIIKSYGFHFRLTLFYPLDPKKTFPRRPYLEATKVKKKKEESSEVCYVFGFIFYIKLMGIKTSVCVSGRWPTDVQFV